MSTNPTTKALDGFQFKQFSIEHTHSAMKVSTDSILLGSWVNVGQAQRILDVGTGSGLLAIMLAQKSCPEAHILGIDIDDGAVLQATHNMRRSPWTNRLHCQKRCVTTVSQKNHYDLIISNPPYFVLQTPTSGKRSADIKDLSRRSARQHSDLDLASLFASVATLMTKQGHFYCILPSQQQDVVALARHHGLYCHHLTHVHSLPGKPAIRQLLHFAKIPGKCNESKLTIHHSPGQYSDDYKKVCGDFYLNF